jgi:hypothetical protein
MMNERIKELAKEAAREMNESGTYSDYKFQAKFAELIVKECINVLAEDDGATHPAELLQKHFGVEE